MNATRKRRLFFLIFALIILALSSFLILYALRQNISLFYTPTQINEGEAPVGRNIRIGGMVLPGSIQRDKKSLNVNFIITDYKNTIHINYSGILPDLFREGQGVIAQGFYEKTSKQFKAKEILAKHDENYMPPEVKQALELSKGDKSS